MKLFRCQNSGCEREFLDAPMWFHRIRKLYFICPECRPDVWERYMAKYREDDPCDTQSSTAGA